MLSPCKKYLIDQEALQKDICDSLWHFKHDAVDSWGRTYFQGGLETKVCTHPTGVEVAKPSSRRPQAPAARHGRQRWTVDHACRSPSQHLERKHAGEFVERLLRPHSWGQVQSRLLATSGRRWRRRGHLSWVFAPCKLMVGPSAGELEQLPRNFLSR